MSDTPETDAMVCEFESANPPYKELVAADFARAQERRIAELKAQLEHAHDVIAHQGKQLWETPVNGSAHEGRDDSPASVAHAPAGPTQGCVIICPSVDPEEDMTDLLQLAMNLSQEIGLALNMEGGHYKITRPLVLAKVREQS